MNPGATRSATGRSGPPATRGRCLIIALLFGTGVVNYLDRGNLSIAAPALSSELNIDSVTMGWIFSAFGWTYAALQVPGGWLADRVHPRILYPLAIAVWSIATCSIGFAGGLAAVVVLRLLVGVFESPTYIMNNRIVTTWFPERERASTVAIYTSAQYVGLGFLAPVLLWIEAAHGWRSIFVLTGILGFVAAAMWVIGYRDPANFRRSNAAEVRLIAEGGGIPDLSTRIGSRTDSRKFRWSELRTVLSRRKLWGIYIGQFCFLASSNFFTTWFPTYLIRYRHMDFVSAGFYASVPFLASFVGVLLSGFLSDALLRRGFTLAWARKLPVLTGIALSTTIVGAVRGHAGDDHPVPRNLEFRHWHGLDHLVIRVRAGAGAADRVDWRSVQPLRRPNRDRDPDRDWLPGAGRRLHARLSAVRVTGHGRRHVLRIPCWRLRARQGVTAATRGVGRADATGPASALCSGPDQMGPVGCGVRPRATRADGVDDSPHGPGLHEPQPGRERLRRR